MRPKIVGEALHEISQDPDVARVMFEILEAESVLGSEAQITLLPEGNELLKQLISAKK
jgi:hypothetical protein